MKLKFLCKNSFLYKVPIKFLLSMIADILINVSLYKLFWHQYSNNRFPFSFNFQFHLKELIVGKFMCGARSCMWGLRQFLFGLHHCFSICQLSVRVSQPRQQDISESIYLYPVSFENIHTYIMSYLLRPSTGYTEVLVSP